MQRETVKQGYNQAAGKYLAERKELGSSKYVQKLIKQLPKGTTILDLGCGDGSRVDDILLKAGHEVIGIDISEEMIKRARKNFPAAQYLVGDISNLRKGEYRAGAVVSFYTIFHLPRARHGELLKIIGSYLPKGGWLLVSLGNREFEGTADFYGTKMWYSQWGTKKNSELVKAAGFGIALDEIDTSGGEKHQVILAQKI